MDCRARRLCHLPGSVSDLSQRVCHAHPHLCISTLISGSLQVTVHLQSQTHSLQPLTSDSALFLTDPWTPGEPREQALPPKPLFLLVGDTAVPPALPPHISLASHSGRHWGLTALQRKAVGLGRDCSSHCGLAKLPNVSQLQLPHLSKEIVIPDSSDCGPNAGGSPGFGGVLPS